MDGACLVCLFLLPAFTCLGHECQDLLSVRWNACGHRLDLGLYSHPKEFWGNGVRTHGKNFLYRKNSPQRSIEPTALHQAEQRAQHTTNKLFQPPDSLSAGQKFA